MNDTAHVPPAYKLYTMYDYGRDKKLYGFISMIDDMKIDKHVPIGDVSHLGRYINRHYQDKNL